MIKNKRYDLPLNLTSSCAVPGGICRCLSSKMPNVCFGTALTRLPRLALGSLDSAELGDVGHTDNMLESSAVDSQISILGAFEMSVSE
jgi:hypothetical protein